MSEVTRGDEPVASYRSYPHRRFNPLSGDWILVSPHRAKRPWQGQVERPVQASRPRYEPDCYLCPGNLRAGGARNPEYEDTFVFTNDFAGLLPDTPELEVPVQPLLRTEIERGTCRVICFSPRHDLTLAEMSIPEIRQVVDTWAAQTEELGREYRWVQVFENKGAIMGCSNPHPHGQIWAESALPDLPARENANQRQYFAERGSAMLSDYAALETSLKERVVVENDDWMVVVPYWATWPFETMLLPRFRVRRLPEVGPAQRGSLAQILKRLLSKYDNLFNVSFPYSMGWHGAPGLGEDSEYWQLHAHWFPPLLRSANVKKFMVGYEMLAEAQRDLTPEQAAARLRELPEAHYKETVTVPS